VTVLLPRSGTGPAPYPGTGQGRDRRRRRRASVGRRVWLWWVEVLVGSAALVALTTTLTAWPSPVPARAMPAGIALVRSGLVIDDPFKVPASVRQLEDHYVFNGSAHPGAGWVAASAKGLGVGIRQHRGWAGWFAVTIPSAGAATLWHVDMTRPSGAVPGGEGEAVFAVQSASTQRNGSINYVIVSSLTDGDRSTWQVGSARGVVADASSHMLWRAPFGTGSPVTFPVTIRTDGRHTLTVWLGDREVYSSHHLDMHDPPPFQAYLEVQAKNAGYVARFSDFWVTDASPVTVEGAPPRAWVELEIGSRHVVSRADRAGQAELQVPPAEAVGTGTLVVHAGTVTRHFPNLHYAAGDVLELSDG